jgi:predicted flap endonuclease-1-like 5' DNA nuclease
MIQVLSFYWVFAALALAIGVIRAVWINAPLAFHPLQAMRHRTYPVLMVLAAMASTFSIVGGRPALWLELGLMVSGSYIVGCYLGFAVSQVAGRRFAFVERSPVADFSKQQGSIQEQGGDELSCLETMDDATRNRLRLLGISRLDQIVRWSEGQARWIDAEFADLGDGISRRWMAEAFERMAPEQTPSKIVREVA